MSLKKPTSKNTNNGMLQFLALQLPYHQIAIRLKIVNHEKFEAVPQLTGGQKPYESVHTLSRISFNTNWIHVLYLVVLLSWNLRSFNKNVNYHEHLMFHKLKTYLRTQQSDIWNRNHEIRTSGSLTLKIQGSYIWVFTVLARWIRSAPSGKNKKWYLLKYTKLE